MKLTFFASVLAVSLFALAHPGRAAVPGADVLADMILAEFDTNSDGSIDGDEWKAGIEKSFDDIDQDHDGKITGEEIDALAGPISESTGTVGAKIATVLVKKLLMLLDKNGDGVITKDEYKEGCDAMFKKLDANHDGKVSKDELLELPAKAFAKS